MPVMLSDSKTLFPNGLDPSIPGAAAISLIASSTSDVSTWAWYFGFVKMIGMVNYEDIVPDKSLLLDCLNVFL